VTWTKWLLDHEHRLAIVMGFVDGILTAMLLTGQRLLGRGSPLDFSVALRVATSALATGGFVFYVGRFAEFRARLMHAEAELSLAKRGHFATTRLGQQALRDAVTEAGLASVCSFAGALLPLSLAIIFRSVPLLAVVFPLLLLTILGMILARLVRGSLLAWAIALLVGGVLIAILGVKLHLV
jgi:predicted membrane protein (TIGR00267 family)